MKTLAGWMAVACLVLAPSVAAAGAPSYPPECNAGTRQDFYDGGWDKAQLWWDLIICPSIPNCESNCEDLSDALIKIINLQTPDDEYAACEFGGFVSHLADLFTGLDCPTSFDCCDTGEDMGEVFGQSYCILALTGFVTDPGDWVRPPAPTCGFWYEYCCDSMFDYTTYWYPNDPLTTPNDECRPYVSGDPWGTTHDHVRELTCQYPIP